MFGRSALDLPFSVRRLVPSKAVIARWWPSCHRPIGLNRLQDRKPPNRTPPGSGSRREVLTCKTPGCSRFSSAAERLRAKTTSGYRRMMQKGGDRCRERLRRQGIKPQNKCVWTRRVRRGCHGSNGARISASGNGERSARTTARTAMRGITSPTIRPARAPITGARTASPVSATTISGCALPLPCGTARTRSSKSGCSA